MKFTFCITRKCNLACRYCCVGKRDAAMLLPTAKRAIEFLSSSKVIPVFRRKELDWLSSQMEQSSRMKLPAS
jgi:hypothetical protein